MGKSRVPVFTTREGKEEHALPAGFDTSEGRVRHVSRVVEDRSITSGRLSIVDLVRIEDIGEGAETATEASCIEIRAVGRDTKVGSDREVFDALIDVRHDISIERGVIALAVGVVSVGRPREEVSCRSIALVLIKAIDHVSTSTTGDVDPVVDLPLE